MALVQTSILRLVGAQAPAPHPSLADAIGQGDVATVHALIESGAHLEERNDKGVTALIVAAGQGDEEMVKTLPARAAMFVRTLETPRHMAGRRLPRRMPMRRPRKRQGERID